MIEYKATQQNISIDYETGRKVISFLIDDPCTNESLEFCRNKTLRLSVKEWKEKRSLDANGYYYKLLGLLADKLKMSRTELHNRMLMEHGQIETVGNQMVYIYLPDTLEAERKAYTSETYHLKPTSEVYVVDGCVKRKWMMVRGSHTYDTQEFSNLLNGLIEECKWQKIPTDTPDQIAALMAAYKETHEHAIA